MILLPQDKKEEIQALTEKAIKDIEMLPQMKKVAKKESQKEMVEELSNIFDYFENEIKSMFFTIEYAWRELQYLTTLGPEVKLREGQLIDFLIDIKRK